MNILTFDTEEWYNYAQMVGKGNFLPDVDKKKNDQYKDIWDANNWNFSLMNFDVR